uniref:DUF3021 family protein n=1 Tax=Macrococcoides canis TaxID=1855823 RepID=A0A6G5ZYB0_9STAP|nr:hypothetical protein SD607_00032 [Macrococcus canis]
MWNNLSNRFINVTLGSIVWIMIITSFSNMNIEIPYLYIWRIILMGSIFGVVFGVIYYYLWNYSNINDICKVLLSSLSNFICIVTTVKLYSSTLFDMLMHFMIFIFIITLVLHYLIFKVYLRVQNIKLTKELEKLH